MSKSQIVERPSYEEFVINLRSALHYLYDPVHLRRSPLVDLLGQSEAPDRAASVQRILIDAIRALEPAEDESPQSAAWRVYDTLNLHYIRLFTHDVVATQLGISERQLRREQRLALEGLAQQLWQKYNLDALPAQANSPTLPVGKAQALSAELDWLKTPEAEELEILQEILKTVLALVHPLAVQRQVPLHLQIEPGLEDLPAPQMTIRSVVLTLLSALIPQVEEGAVRLNVQRAGPDIEIDITCAGIRPTLAGFDAPAGPEESGLETVRQLAAFYGASLSVELIPPAFCARLRFPIPEQIPILVVDDNADWLEMLTRYAVGSRYRVITAREPRTAAALAEKVQPGLIFLDVMMPNVDGWQVLNELRQSQSTQPIPIVVCSVLPLADLALSLGVNAFLQKPVTQDQFLGVLDRLLKQPQD